MKIENIKEITTDYFEYEAVSSSFLYGKECQLLNYSYSNYVKEDSEAIVIGNIIDKYVQDKDILKKVIWFPVRDKGYKMWREGLSIEEVLNLNIPYAFSELKEKYEPIYIKYWNQDKKRWDNGRTEEEKQICVYSKKYEDNIEKLHQVEKEYNFYIENYGEYFHLLCQHKTKEIILLNEISDKPNELFETISKMIYTIDNNEQFKELIKPEEFKEIFYQYALCFDLDGVHCKSLPDIVIIHHKKQTIEIIDVKTTKRKVLDSYRDKRYFRQLAFYLLPIEELYPDYHLGLCGIFQIREDKFKNVSSKLYYISYKDIKIAREGGMLKPEFQTQLLSEKEDVIECTERFEILSKIGIINNDKRYRVYGIEELIEEIKKDG